MRRRQARAIRSIGYTYEYMLGVVRWGKARRQVALRQCARDQPLRGVQTTFGRVNTFMLPPNATRGTPSTPESDRTEQSPVRTRT
jgi:hypothetical protein